MRKDERDLLEVLKFELKFLEEGGYGRSPRASWRPQLIFEDSPTCMNFSSMEETGPCTECVLIQLVPPEFRSEEIPCRHIRLDSSGETLDSLYRYGDQVEIEEVVGGWLRATVRRIEEERASAAGNQSEQPATGSGATTKGLPSIRSSIRSVQIPPVQLLFNGLEAVSSSDSGPTTFRGAVAVPSQIRQVRFRASNTIGSANAALRRSPSSLTSNTAWLSRPFGRNSQ